MKIRTDFVTNSSSSSFVCYGVSLDEIPKDVRPKWDDEFDIGGPYDYKFIGFSPETLRTKFADRPLGEIKKIVAEALNRRFGTSFTEDDITYYEEGWYDG